MRIVRSTRFATLAALLLLSWPSSPLRAQQVPPGDPVIDRVVVRTHNVFDSTEARGNFLFRLANALHFTTRSSVVRHELLFKEGDRYDAAKVAETLRNLRARGLFRDVRIETQPSDSGVEVLVETADGWTTEAVLNARFTAGEFSWALGGRERNVLGTGAELGVVYRDEPDRTALQLSGAVPRIRGTRFEVRGFFHDLSDGDVGGWSVALPFRSLADRNGFALTGFVGRQRILQFRDGDSLETYRRRVFLQRGEVAYAPYASSAGYVRVGLAAQIKREEYLLWGEVASQVPDTVTGAVGAFAEVLLPRFKVVTHYDGFAREVDLDLSTRLAVGAWIAPSGLGYRETGIGPSAYLQTGVSWGRNFAKLQAWANGLFTDTGLDSGQVRAALTLASQVIPKNAIVFHIEAGSRRGTPPGSEFDLGHGQGPRVFGPHAFTGDRSLWGTLEHRAFLVDEFAGVIGVGLAGFVDYGGAWYADQEARVGGDIGLGLRFGATRSTGQNIGRLDVAYRFGDGWEGSRWAVSFGRGFAF